MKPTWAEAKVLEIAGIDPATAQDWEIYLADRALARCYYIDLAAEEFQRLLGLPQWQPCG